MKNNQIQKKVVLKTYGCQMNEYDSELIRSILHQAGFTLVDDELAADVVMLNTCAVRENAQRKIFGAVHDIRHRRVQAAGPGGGNAALIGILGCMATNLRQELLDDKSLNIDFIAGPDSYKRLPEIIQEAAGKHHKVFDVTLSEFETYSDVYPQREGGVNAWLAVMRGCDNFCTFCVVPYTRGRERSRSIPNILDEVRRLAGEGFKQVTLLGQNVNSYRSEEGSFADLLEAVSRVDGIERIRFTSPHPKDFPQPLLEVIAGNPKVCKHIHLPLQAGNNRILDLMGRTYTQEDYLALVDKIRKLYPSMALTTDIIIGFPTETEEDFEDTVRVMRQVQFDAAYIFKYSQRKGTIAERKFPDDVPEEAKTRRIIRLNDLQREISQRKNEAHINDECIALIEQERTTDGNNSLGRTDGNTLVKLPLGPARGDFVRVRILTASPHALCGDII